MKTSKVFTITAGLFFLVGCSGNGPSTIGMGKNGLKDCPDRPNCVSSTATIKERAVEPFFYTCQKKEAFERLIRIISGQNRATIVQKTDDYLHVEFRSKIFRFVDDVEFYFPKNKPVIHIRSAARLGYSDMGVNQSRVEALRALFMGAVSAEIGHLR